jgi:hypothetical protein
MAGALERSGTCGVGVLSALASTVRKKRRLAIRILRRCDFIRDPETDKLRFIIRRHGMEGKKEAARY